MNSTQATMIGTEIIKGKNRQVQQQYDRAEKWREHAEGLQDELNALSNKFEYLSSRNERLETLIASMTKKGVASEALGTIHTLKAEALQKQAFEEEWTVEQRREANLKLAAEAEYDYRLKNDPSYRLNTAAEALQRIAKYSDCADQIRNTVSKMFASGKVRKLEEKDRMIVERVAEMKMTARYETEHKTVPLPDSIPPARLEIDEKNKEEYDTFSEIASEPIKSPVFVY